MQELGPINLVPWGLQNLMGLKGPDGVVRKLLDVLHPNVDLWDMLAASNAREVVSGSVNVNAVGNWPLALPGTTVPAGEAWLVRGCGLSATTAGAEVIRLALWLIGVSNNGVRQLTDYGASSLTDAVGVGQANVGYRYPSPFFMYAGESISAQVLKITTAGNISVGISAAIYRFRA